MPYINDRVVHDADSHTMELPNWFDEFGTDRVKKIFKKRFQKTHLEGVEGLKTMPALHQKNQYRSRNEEEIMLRKNYHALGAFNGLDRSEAIDHLGVASQLVFPTSEYLFCSIFRSILFLIYYPIFLVWNKPIKRENPK